MAIRVLVKRLAPLFFTLGGPSILSRIADRLDIKSGRRSLQIRKPAERVFQVLVYHRVSPYADGVFDPVDPEVFKAQVGYLARHHRVLTAGEAWERAESGSLPGGAAVVTFDDGYRDNYTYAFPILKKLGVPATLFLSTGPLDGLGPLWHDRVFSAFAITTERGWVFQNDTYALGGAVERWNAAQRFAGFVRTLNENDREERIAELCENLRVPPGEAESRSPMLTWAQVREMADWGVEIGAHTVSHPILSRISARRQREEIAESVERIQYNIGKRPAVFAYPNGRPEDFDQRTVDVLRDCRIQAAYTTVLGTNSCLNDPYRLRRGAAWATDLPTFSLQMAWSRLTT